MTYKLPFDINTICLTCLQDGDDISPTKLYYMNRVTEAVGFKIYPHYKFVIRTIGYFVSSFLVYDVIHIRGKDVARIRFISIRKDPNGKDELIRCLKVEMQHIVVSPAMPTNIKESLTIYNINTLI